MKLYILFEKAEFITNDKSAPKHKNTKHDENIERTVE